MRSLAIYKYKKTPNARINKIIKREKKMGLIFAYTK